MRVHCCQKQDGGHHDFTEDLILQLLRTLGLSSGVGDRLGLGDPCLHTALQVHTWKRGRSNYQTLYRRSDTVSTNCRGIAQGILVIGPEGDFTMSELEMLTNNGAVLVGLGSNRLRVETAAIALLSVAQLLTGP